MKRGGFGGELLAIDFYGHAATQLHGAATADDIDFSYPKGTLPALALRIERLLLGAYVGAAATLQTPALRLALAQVAANGAQHAAAWGEPS